MKYLQEKTFKVIPINTKTSNKKYLEKKIYKNVDEINFDIDFLDIIRSF